MHRQTWDAHTTAMMVVEGLNGKPVAERCAEHHLSPAPSDQWREQCVANAPKALEVPEQRQRDARLAREKPRLKPLVGELTLEGKQRAELLGGRGAGRCQSSRVIPSGSHASRSSRPRPRSGATVGAGRTGASARRRGATRNQCGA
jgi:hypothetical protein